VTGTVTVTDKAGNNATFTSPAVKIDKTPPTITGSRTPLANANGWNNTDVTANYTASDGLSGLDASSPPTGSFIFNTEGASQSHPFTVTDQAGNSASFTVSNVNIDKTPPIITFVSRTPANSYGWNNSAVTLNWSCTDNLSGPVQSSLTNTLPNEGANQSSTTTCMDLAGNSSSNTQTGINIDLTPPTLNPSISPTPVLLNGSATASPNASDNLSGIASQSCPAVVTNSVGSHSLTCTATDKAGNTTNKLVTYNVYYASSGTCDGDAGHAILQPINATGTISVFKLGSTVPTKFRVCDANGVSIQASGPNPVVTGYGLVAAANSPTITVDEDMYSTTPDTAFRWDPTGQQWIFNQSTKNNMTLKSGVTYYFAINLNDGSTIFFQYGLK